MTFAVALRADVPGFEHAGQQVGDLLLAEGGHGSRLLLFGSLQVPQLHVDLLADRVEVEEREAGQAEFVQPLGFELIGRDLS